MTVENDLKLPSSKSNEPRKFAHDIIWVGVAQLFNSIIAGVGTMPALTKFYSADIYGVWTQINVTVGLLAPLVAMELSLSVVRFLSHEDDQAKQRQVLGSMLFAITVVSCVFLIVGNLLTSQLSVILFSRPDYPTFTRLTVLWIVVSAFFGFFISYLRARGKIKLLSVRQILVALFTLAIVIGLAIRGIGLEWIVTSVIGVWAIFTLFFVVMTIREIGWPLPNLTGLRSYLAFSIPQMPGGILLWIIISSDRYFITHFLGLSQTGIYNSSFYLGNLISLFYFPIQFVLYPMLSRLWEEKRIEGVKQYLEYSTKVFLTLALPAAAGVALLSQPLLQLLTTSEYLAGSALVFLISLGVVFLGIFQINVNIALLLKQTKLLPLMIGAASIVSVLINFILIPRFGLIGAAVANMISFFILANIVTVWARKQVGYGIDVKYLLKVAGATVITSVVLYFFKAHGIVGLVIAVVTGSLVYAASLFLMKGFSDRDKKLITNVLGTLIPKRQDD